MVKPKNQIAHSELFHVIIRIVVEVGHTLLGLIIRSGIFVDRKTKISCRFWSWCLANVSVLGVVIHLGISGCNVIGLMD